MEFRLDQFYQTKNTKKNNMLKYRKISNYWCVKSRWQAR